MTLELRLKGKRNICKVAVYSNFVVFLPHKSPQHGPEGSSSLDGRGYLSPPQKRPGLRDSQEGPRLPPAAAPRVRNQEVVAVEDSTDDN